MNQFSRTEMLIGREGILRLKSASVIVFGLGGVGSYAAEALARSGIGRIGIVDGDSVCVTNINRQLIATHSTFGKQKTEVMRKRIIDINPKAKVIPFDIFYDAETCDQVDLTEYDYVLDAIDTVESKLLLIENARAAGAPIISCMGAGNKLDATGFKVANISETAYCPLAKIMRRELRDRGIESLKVVYSEEAPMQAADSASGESMPDICEYEPFCEPCPSCKREGARRAPGSVPFVPPVMGLIAAGEVIKDLLLL